MKHRQSRRCSGRADARADLPGDGAAAASTSRSSSSRDRQDLLQVELDWPTPDDYDLEVYRKNADGSLAEVASSGNFVGEKELVTAAGPGAGHLRPPGHQLRVGHAELDADRRAVNTDASTVPGLVENWTLTCERGRQVLQTCRWWSTAASRSGPTSPPAGAAESPPVAVVLGRPPPGWAPDGGPYR